ncbi:lipoprotein NlpD [Burkholderia sp. WP9]|uniref:peptidoglycan DD-metalloendopeptidase family protein n=1 Tax=Burkholderia sp. WP9 TaxID=1500263 RepID=UPI00089A0173|nr:peptidoglycan DD-metalloendopeptidase family protein [Burkholderia sp. WP9]SEE75754.1 lipoprotein NlpD [Burkholderia sp. WP9]
MGKRFDRTMLASLAGAWVALAVSGCANVGQQGAQTGAASGAAVASGVPAASAPASDAAAATPAALSAEQSALLKKSPPLVYRVKRGDTLARIAQHHHCSVGQLQAWNGLKASSRLKRGQVLHVASPETVRAVNAANAAAKAAAASGAAASAAARQAAASGASVAGAPQSQSAQSPAPSAAEAREVAQQTARHANAVSLAWPAGGSVVEGFQPGETRGIEIGGKPGDPVRAAADGKVMYAGMGLNGYGSLIIVQHNKDFLTAYSHNRKLLVKTGDIVVQGQQIAEMGDEKNSRVSLGFELRRDGKPIDPMPYLPQGRG